MKQEIAKTYVKQQVKSVKTAIRKGRPRIESKHQESQKAREHEKLGADIRPIACWKYKLEHMHTILTAEKETGKYNKIAYFMTIETQNLDEFEQSLQDVGKDMTKLKVLVEK